jgi:hypothetical protein
VTDGVEPPFYLDVPDPFAEDERAEAEGLGGPDHPPSSMVTLLDGRSVHRRVAQSKELRPLCRAVFSLFAKTTRARR